MFHGSAEQAESAPDLAPQLLRSGLLFPRTLDLISAIRPITALPPKPARWPLKPSPPHPCSAAAAMCPSGVPPAGAPASLCGLSLHTPDRWGWLPLSCNSLLHFQALSWQHIYDHSFQRKVSSTR